MPTLFIVHIRLLAMMSEEKLIQIGQVIKQLAFSKYKSNLDFAAACEVDEKTIRRIFAGKQNFSIQILGRICKVLDIKMSTLLIMVKE